MGCNLAYFSWLLLSFDITDCARTGGDMLTILGTNFGIGGPNLIMVGSDECDKSTLGANDSFVMCILRGGRLMKQAGI